MRVLARDLRRARAASRRAVRPKAGRRLPGSVAGARVQGRALRIVAGTLLAAPRSGDLADIERGRYAVVVSHRRDGAPVATPVWAAVRDGRIFVRTERSSGKVRRIERDPRVLVAPSDSAGRPVGAPLEAHARILATSEEPVAESALASRFGFARASFERAMDAMRIDMCYLELTPVAAPGDGSDTPGPCRMVARNAGNRVASMQHTSDREVDQWPRTTSAMRSSHSG
jgi:PPOX class probable F420-dependent enzyme